MDSNRLWQVGTKRIFYLVVRTIGSLSQEPGLHPGLMFVAGA